MILLAETGRVGFADVTQLPMWRYGNPSLEVKGNIYTADQLQTAIAAARLKALEEAAMLATPLLPRPCDCEVCDCGNSGDYARVVDWDSSNNLANAIRELKGAT
jgi:hypothetical protein